MKHFHKKAYEAYKKGKAEGVITDSIKEICIIVAEKGIASYGYEHGTYIFDSEDIDQPLTREYTP